MILREMLKITNPKKKVKLFVNDKEVGIYENSDSLREESMYQSYLVKEVSATIIDNKSVLVLKIES